MKTITKFILSGVVTMMSLPVLAQNPDAQISGMVVDQQGIAITGAAVILQTADSVYVAGTLTGIDGIFEFDSAVRPYRLLFQHVSYESLVLEGSENDLGRIVLAENKNAIDAVVVTAEKPLVRIDDGKLVYDSSSLLAGRVAGSAYDVVKQVPGVYEDDDKLSLSGANQPTVIINGKPSTMSAEQLSNLLRTMPAGRVAEVEVIYSAPPQYHIRGAVINVVLKNSLNNIVAGELFGEYSNRYLDSWRGGADVIFSTPKLSGDFMYSYALVNNITNIDLVSKHLFEGNIYDIRQMQEIRNRSQVHDVRVGLDYDFSEDNALSLTYTASVLPPMVSTAHAVGNYVNSTSNIEGDNAMHNVSLGYSWRKRLSAGMDYTVYRMHNSQLMTDSHLPDMPDFVSHAAQSVQKAKIYLDNAFVLKNNWNMRCGLSFDCAVSNDFQEYVSENCDMSDNDIASTLKEYAYDLYAGADKSFVNGVSMSAYVTGEYYRRDGYERLALLPQLSLTYMSRPDHILQLAVSSDKIYPSYWQMLEAVNYIDGYSQVMGNASLKPMYNYQAVAMYMFRQKYILQLFYVHTQNYFQQSVFQSPDGLSLIYQTLNWNYAGNCGFNVIVPFKAWRVWDARITLTGTDMRVVSDDFNGMAVDRHKWGWRLYVTNSFVLSRRPALSIDVSGWYQSSAIQCTYDIASVWSVNAGLKCSLFDDKLSVNLSCNDIFETAVPKINVNMNSQNIEMIMGRYTRTVTLRLTCKIGSYKQRAYREVDTSRFGH